MLLFLSRTIIDAILIKHLINMHPVSLGSPRTPLPFHYPSWWQRISSAISRLFAAILSLFTNCFAHAQEDVSSIQHQYVPLEVESLYPSITQNFANYAGAYFPTPFAPPAEPGMSLVSCRKVQKASLEDKYKWQNNIPPRLQWSNNHGYCGEVCMISAGLSFGQYLSQYDVRAIATKNAPQNTAELLLGKEKNDQYAATQMRMNSIEWDTDSEQNTPQFLAWVKKMVLNGFPVAIGVFMNQYYFYDDSDPDDGDSEYDHIVYVVGIESNHPLSDTAYYPDDLLIFSDNGLAGDPGTPPQYIFKCPFDAFQKTRQQANSPSSPPYSLSNSGTNYGITLTGITDLNHDTVPVRVDTNVNYESPEIADKSSVRPSAMPLTITITVSDLTPNVLYNLYRYDDETAVPVSQFNANAHSAVECIPIMISSGSTFVTTRAIQSSNKIFYRAVAKSAP
jgi:hypothetical protein